MKLTCGHPERKHKSLGKCRSCYETSRLKVSKVLATKCPHVESPHRGLGKCGPCYRRDRINNDLNGKRAVCHPTRSHYSNGKCWSCYKREFASGTKATCHPSEPHLASGYCQKCWKKNRNLKAKYNIGIPDLLRLWEEAGRCCEICSKPLKSGMELDSGTSAHIDHDHKTGEIRGILCRNCNRGLGLLGDNLNTINRARGYLLRSTKCH